MEFHQTNRNGGNVNNTIPELMNQAFEAAKASVEFTELVDFQLSLDLQSEGGDEVLARAARTKCNCLTNDQTLFEFDRQVRELRTQLVCYLGRRGGRESGVR